AQGVLKKHPFCGAFLVFWGFKFLSMYVALYLSPKGIGSARRSLETEHRERTGEEAQRRYSHIMLVRT
ncbi:hypothetical protein ACP0G4_26665, partial [Escherichia coli]